MCAHLMMQQTLSDDDEEEDGLEELEFMNSPDDDMLVSEHLDLEQEDFSTEESSEEEELSEGFPLQTNNGMSVLITPGPGVPTMHIDG